MTDPFSPAGRFAQRCRDAQQARAYEKRQACEKGYKQGLSGGPSTPPAMPYHARWAYEEGYDRGRKAAKVGEA